MIPQTQRWWRGAVLDSDGEQTDEGGDCFAACIASILELPYDGGFPNCLNSRPYGEGGWWHRWQIWLYDEHRQEAIFYDTDALAAIDRKEFAWWIAGVNVGTTPHCVVFYRDEFRWDPAPEGHKREWTPTDVTDAIAIFSISSLRDRPDGPYSLHLAPAEASA